MGKEHYTDGRVWSEKYNAWVFPETGDAKSVQAINIIFDGPSGPTAGRFIELDVIIRVETDDGKSINAGEWLQREDGLWALRITRLPSA